MESVELVLTRDELVHIEGLLTPSEEGGGEGLRFDRESCLKIGSALLYALETGEPQAVALSEHELWTVREHSSLQAQTPSSPQLGLELKSKVYEALLLLDSEYEVSLLPGGSVEASEDWEPQRLKEWLTREKRLCRKRRQLKRRRGRPRGSLRRSRSGG